MTALHAGQGPDVTGPVLAHYGGAPEALTIALPVAIFVGFLVMEKKARRRERERADQDAGSPGEAPRDRGPDPAG